MDVWLRESSIEQRKVLELAHALGRHFRVRQRPVRATHSTESARVRPVPLEITDKPLPGPYAAHPDVGVRVSTEGSTGLAYYAGIDEATYLLLCSLLGIAQYRVMWANPLLRPEDFRHPPHPLCLFGDIEAIHGFARLLEAPQVCGGCTAFYHCLGADTELIALRETVSAIQRQPDAGRVGKDIPWNPMAD